jgi:hypothetical protein
MRRQLAFSILLPMCVGPALAQQQIDPSNLIPVTSPLIDAGTFNWSTKRWVSPRAAEALRAASQTVYNNTCTWTGGNFYTGMADCTVAFDEGRIPSTTSPGAPAGATDDNLIDSFQIAYCGLQPTGSIDIKIGFYNNLGGGCLQALGGVPYTGPLSTLAQGYFDFGSAAGNPLPGNNACWAVTIMTGNNAFCLLSDGDGQFSNVPDFDNFNWSFQSDTAPVGINAGAGPYLAGEPSIGGVGACTYNIPCGTDLSPAFGNVACGSGLDTEDHFWTNVDGDMWGDVINTGTVCTASPGAGSTCYWFQGYPGNPFASFWMKIGSSGSCAGCNGSPTPYCTAGTTTNGCNATVSLQGVPSISNPAPANIVVSNVEGAKTGLIFYGLARAALPWGTGTSFLCVKPPTQRILAQPTGGTAGLCNGSMSNDINAYWATHPIALGQPIFAGQVIDFQGWFRDPPAPKTTNLSNGLEITLCP